MSKCTSNRVYLLSGMLNWILDNNLTPHIVVKADFPQVEIPREFVSDGRIVLNIAPSAIRNFFLSARVLRFDANFSRKPYSIYIPLGAIEAIYAQENGHGLHLEGIDGPPPEMPDKFSEEVEFVAAVQPKVKTKKTPKLRVISSSKTKSKDEDNKPQS